MHASVCASMCISVKFWNYRRQMQRDSLNCSMYPFCWSPSISVVYMVHMKTAHICITLCHWRTKTRLFQPDIQIKGIEMTAIAHMELCFGSFKNTIMSSAADSSFFQQNIFSFTFFLCFSFLLQKKNQCNSILICLNRLECDKFWECYCFIAAKDRTEMLVM